MIASTAKTKIQAVTENCMVCRSQRNVVGFGPALEVVESPNPEVLLLDAELRGLACSVAGVDVDEDDDDVCLVDWEDPPRDIGSTTRPGSM